MENSLLTVGRILNRLSLPQGTQRGPSTLWKSGGEPCVAVEVRHEEDICRVSEQLQAAAIPLLREIVFPDGTVAVWHLREGILVKITTIMGSLGSPNPYLERLPAWIRQALTAKNLPDRDFIEEEELEGLVRGLLRGPYFSSRN